MPRTWSAKRERQYAHIKKGLVDAGRTEGTATRIAARTVNKERARHGESRTASPESMRDLSSSRRGGLNAHRGRRGPTKQQLYGEARRRNVPGRSTMNKAQLQRALARLGR